MLSRTERLRVACAALAVSVLGSESKADIHEYEIRRLLYLGTSCGVMKLEQVEPPRSEWRRFKAECRDVSAYPHGLHVTCTDSADDRSCKVETEAREFDSLELLRQR